MSGTGAALAHRSVANIKTSISAPQGQSSPATPHTPPRTISGSFSSPSSIRADDDFILIEIGSRHVSAGFAGDSAPKATLNCGTNQQRRAGDYGQWQGSCPPSHVRANDYELWNYDLRNIDLGLFTDKLDRLLREAFTKFLLIDSRPRRIGLILDPAVPIPLLSAVLDTLFGRFMAPMISLMSSPTMAAVGAGVRSALVIDLGWTETIVTSVYEYREVKSARSVRGGKLLVGELYKLLRALIPSADDDDADDHMIVSFEECEDILHRLMWCRASASRSSQRQSTQLDTVEEQDESGIEPSQPSGIAEVPLSSVTPPMTLHVPFNKLADVCEDVYFASSAAQSTFDDHELPVDRLVYQHLLQLPLDVRAVCMSRIIFTGGCSNILGIKERIVDEVSNTANRRGWTPIFGKGVEQLRSNAKLQGKWSGQQRSSFSSARTADSAAEESSTSPQSDADGIESAEVDAVEAKIARNRPTRQQLQGQFRAVHSLGPWTGASLLCQLKTPAIATIDRELWLLQGASGASRPADVDVKTQQRQSMGAGGLIRGSGGHHTNWTLGVWGAL